MTKLREKILAFLESDLAKKYGKIWEDSLTLNKCIRAFGIDVVLYILITSIRGHLLGGSPFQVKRGDLSERRLPRGDSGRGIVVSVGSGNGLLERILYDCYLSIFGLKLEVICVDPNPLSFASRGLSETFFEPSFPRVSDLVNSRPELVGNERNERGVFLLLNWCYPLLSYDREAVEKLKPKTVFSTVEVFNGQAGAAGSPEFFEWYQSPLFEGEEKVDFRLRGCTYDLRIFLRGNLGEGVKSLDPIYDSCMVSFDDFSL